MNSIELIKRYGMIMEGQMLMKGTRPIKGVIPILYEQWSELPATYITAWWTDVYVN